MGTRNGFVASEKGAAAEKECDVGSLALRMQTTTNNTTNNKSFSRKKKMMMMVDTTHHYNHHHGDNHDDDDDDDDDESTNLVTPSTGGGEEEVHGCEGSHSSSLPFPFNNNQQVVASMSDMYDVVGSTHHYSTPLRMPLPPKSLLFPEYSGVMVNTANSFTAAQRQELERQTMVYKYMVASLPVPPQLLIPISKTTSNFPHFNSNRSKGSLELGVSNSTDPEPWRCRRTDGKKWRCRRTDGKKWRCSRNVVPDQKYCERHSHKSRPRSRKPVEQQQQLLLNSHFFNNNNNNNNNTNLPYSKPSNFLDQREKHHSHDSQTRGVEWFMKGEEAKYSNQEWRKNSSNVSHTKPQNERGFGYYNNQIQGGLQSQELNGQFISSLIEPKLAVPTNQTRHFIEAWSMAETDHQRDHITNMGGGDQIGGRSTNNDNKYSFVSSNNKVFPYSSLTLSMHNNSSTEEESENSQMGFGFEEEGDNNMKSQWMNYNVNSVSWNVSGSTSPSTPPGGPLAEALCLGMAGSTRPSTSSRSSS